MKVRLRFHRGTPVVLLASVLFLLGAWWAARDYRVPAAGWLIWGGFAAGVLIGIAEHVRAIRRGWLPKRDKAAQRALAWRIGAPLALFGSGIIRFFELHWLGVIGAAALAGMGLTLSLKPDLPEREVRGWWR